MSSRLSVTSIGSQSANSILDDYEFVHKEDDLEQEFKLIPTHHDLKEMNKCIGYLHNYVPITFWLPRYQWKQWFLPDLIAGITGIVMLIPQGMGYALVAGLDVKYGLYSSLMGPLLYFCFGTCGQLSVAPMAIVSLMTLETVSSYDTIKQNPDNIALYAAYASCLSFQVGIIQFVLGLLHAGILANMLANPVMTGFTTAASILIIMSQMKFIFNFDIVGVEFVVKLISIVKNILNGLAHWQSILMFIGFSIFLLFLSKWKNSNWKFNKQSAFIPGALIVVTIATAISYLLRESSGMSGVAVIGDVAKGLPKFVNFLDLVGDDFWTLWVPALLMAILGFIESFSVAEKFGNKHDYHCDASQELISLGICNLVGCWFQIYPIGGALSRCAVIEAAGAKTPLNSLFSGIGMLISCSFLLFLFEWLPKPALAAIVATGAIGLFDYKEIFRLFRINKRDFYVTVITILATLFIGIDIGVALGVLASILMFVQASAKPIYAILGKVSSDPTEKNLYRNIKHHKDCITRDDMLIIRWDASLFFANVQSFQHCIRKQIGSFLVKNSYPNKWCLAVCFSGVNHIDTTAAGKLITFFNEIKQKNNGMTLLIAKIKKQCLETLKKTNVLEVIGEDHVLMEVYQTEVWWDNKLQKKDLDFDEEETVDYQYEDGKQKGFEHMASMDLKTGLLINSNYSINVTEEELHDMS